MSSSPNIIQEYDTYLRRTVAIIRFQDWSDSGKPNFLWFFHRKVTVDIYLEYQVDENRFYIIKRENGKEVKRTLTKTGIENSLAILLGIKKRVFRNNGYEQPIERPKIVTGLPTETKRPTIITDKVSASVFDIIKELHDSREKRIEEDEIQKFLL